MNEFRANRNSVFAEIGLKKTIENLVGEIQAPYEADEIPWVVGYSGGKDSTAIAQLVWYALEELPAERRHKNVHVICSDTLVENPVVAAWVGRSLDSMTKTADEKNLPISAHNLTPSLRDRFWVNLIGRGYPAPRHKFRWCTERMKIRPADEFINSVVQENGEAVLVLGTRKAESAGRAHRMKTYESQRIRENLNAHGTLPNAFVYAPIGDWSNDDVWLYLMQQKNPWGYNNKDLLTMYQGASADGECPLVLDSTTPSCGNSRFGCWVCTLVDEDKSMSAMIQNDQEKEWMFPLLNLRNELDQPDHEKRDFRRMTGHVQLYKDPKEENKEKTVPGPYTQKSREDWLRKLLVAQEQMRSNPASPPEARGIELIAPEELHEIRRIWVLEKHEIEDTLPQIYQEVTGRYFDRQPLDDSTPYGEAEMDLLRAVCGENEIHFSLLRELLSVEKEFRGLTKRSNLFDRIDRAFQRNFYDDVEDAKARASRKRAFTDIEKTLEAGELSSEHAVEAAQNLMSGEDVEHAPIEETVG